MTIDNVKTRPAARCQASVSRKPCVCHCMQVEAEILEVAIRNGEAKCVESLMRVTGAGQGCGACTCKLSRLVEGKPINTCSPCSFCHECGSIQKLCSCRP